MDTSLEALGPQHYINLDLLPDIGKARQVVRDEAWVTVRDREKLLAEDREIFIPLEIDALSTAENVIEAGNTHGKNSPEYLDRLDGLNLDCLRLVAEWYRKMT